ncbi:MAG TPA: DUF58 domain-containing protein [Verrucomicrobiales bacterium]|nr:DUF58 domain-containing protein [Verrucomicrobiae bacterium]MCP5554031.1 DUF58 domain-containing protein [Akkermansiaceae bacterium]HRX56301.1 DUF58 domain-containing protein [Verrucomicrobiales bacterium]
MATLSTDNDSLFDAEFLGRLRALFLRLRKRRQLKKKGIQNTTATGFTREFKDFRHYTPDDDYRSIDWRLYARLDRLYVRLYEEVQEFHVHILVDTSASMVTPFGDKRLSALRLAVALAYLGLIGQHRVSLYRMADRIIEGLPPQKGQGNIQRIIDYAKRLEFGGMTDLKRCFSSFRPSRQRYGIIFVISDLYGRDADEAKDAVQRIASWPGEAHVIQIFNPWEEHPDLDGEVELIDVETQEHRKLWFTKRELKRYEEVFDLFLKTVEHTCKSRQIDYQRWCTDQPFEEAFLDLLSRGSALASGA